MNSHLWTEIISKANDEVAKGHHWRFVVIQMAIELQIELAIHIFKLPLSCLPTKLFDSWESIEKEEKVEWKAVKAEREREGGGKEKEVGNATEWQTNHGVLHHLCGQFLVECYRIYETMYMDQYNVAICIV